MRILSNEHAAEVQAIDLYRLATETLARHMILAAEYGTPQHAAEYLAELARRETQTVLERAA